MAIDVRRITNVDEYRPSLRRDERGWYLTEYWRVRTHDIVKATQAPGLPEIGKVYQHPDAPPDLKVRGYGEVVLEVERDNGTGEVGSCRVPVEYRTPDATGGNIRIPQSTLDQWTVETIGRLQETVYESLERTLPTGGNFPGEVLLKKQIRNGEGTPVDVASVELRVYTHLPKNVVPPFQRMLELSQPAKINENDIKLPPLYGSTSRLDCKKGQLKYLGFERSVVGEFQQVVHILELRKDFKVRWQLLDADGLVVSGVVEDRVNEYAPFEGLWWT